MLVEAVVKKDSEDAKVRKTEEITGFLVGDGDF